jgi:hypothetical protein
MRPPEDPRPQVRPGRTDDGAAMTAGTLFCLILVAAFTVFILRPEVDAER